MESAWPALTQSGRPDFIQTQRPCAKGRMADAKQSYSGPLKSARRSVMRTLRLAALLLSMPALHGCATLSEAQCGMGDWFGIGEVDARSGYTDRVPLHNKACAEYGIAVDPDEYDAGYAQGLIAFCVPTEAFALGRRGATYYGQCPPDTERDFIPAYELGGDLYAVELELLQLDNEIERLRKAGRAEDVTEDELADIDTALSIAKRDRRRRDEDRSRIIDRASRRGYGQVW